MLGEAKTLQRIVPRPSPTDDVCGLIAVSLKAVSDQSRAIGANAVAYEAVALLERLLSLPAQRRTNDQLSGETGATLPLCHRSFSAAGRDAIGEMHCERSPWGRLRGTRRRWRRSSSPCSHHATLVLGVPVRVLAYPCLSVTKPVNKLRPARDAAQKNQ